MNRQIILLLLIGIFVAVSAQQLRGLKKTKESEHQVQKDVHTKNVQSAHQAISNHRQSHQSVSNEHHQMEQEELDHVPKASAKEAPKAARKGTAEAKKQVPKKSVPKAVAKVAAPAKEKSAVKPPTHKKMAPKLKHVVSFSQVVARDPNDDMLNDPPVGFVQIFENSFLQQSSSEGTVVYELQPAEIELLRKQETTEFVEQVNESDPENMDSILNNDVSLGTDVDDLGDPSLLPTQQATELDAETAYEMSDFIIKSEVVPDDSGYTGENLQNPYQDDSYLFKDEETTYDLESSNAPFQLDIQYYTDSELSNQIAQ